MMASHGLLPQIDKISQSLTYIFKGKWKVMREMCQHMLEQVPKIMLMLWESIFSVPAKKYLFVD